MKTLYLVRIHNNSYTSPSRAQLFVALIFGLCSEPEPGEVFVDDPAEVPWLAELLHSVSVDGPALFPSSYWAG